MQLDYKNLSDHELSSFLKREDRLAFTEIYDRYWAVLYLHARRMLRSKEEAQDVVQELFTQLWQNSSQLDVQVKLSSYLYRSVRNRVFNHLQRMKVAGDYQQSLLDFVEAGAASSDELVREKELAVVIEREIQALPDRMRELFMLSRKQYLSYKEIGEVLGISENTVRNQVSSALGILRDKLGVSSVLIYILLSK